MLKHSFELEIASKKLLHGDEQVCKDGLNSCHLEDLFSMDDLFQFNQKLKHL